MVPPAREVREIDTIQARTTEKTELEIGTIALKAAVVEAMAL